MPHFDELDYFTEPSIIDDPYPYFEYLRSKGPVCFLPNRNVVAVTGFDEAVAILNDSKTFSSANSTSGPVPAIPFTPEGDDVTALLEEFRSQMFAAGMVVTMDGAIHAKTRSLLMRLFTPSRLKDNELFLSQIADRQIDEFIDQGHCEVISAYGSPYAILVIANLLGVPEEDWKTFRERLVLPAHVDDTDSKEASMDGFKFLFSYFAQYIGDRRDNPRSDVLTELATARFPDGSTPEVMEVVWLAAFLFGAGQDTTARLLSAALLVLAERQDLQTLLRADRTRIPAFIEEVLRIDGPVKHDARLAVKTSTIGGVQIKAGATVSLFNGAINRDPRRYDAPSEFQLDRPKGREHLAFGRGAHTCAGAPLARAEVRASLNRLLDRLFNIRVSQEHHGPSGNRRLSYDPSFTLRGLKELHLEFESSSIPAKDQIGA